jgi:hypothetical protein
VIRFLHAEEQSAAEIHRRLYHVYGDNVTSDSCVREWCRKFRDGRTSSRMPETIEIMNVRKPGTSNNVRCYLHYPTVLIPQV